VWRLEIRTAVENRAVIAQGGKDVNDPASRLWETSLAFGRALRHMRRGPAFPNEGQPICKDRSKTDD